MKNYLIISTYPEQGSQNIGDALITDATIQAIKDVKGEENSQFSILWREEDGTKAKKQIDKADAIIFACFAIRKNLASKYSFIQEVIESNKPFAILAAGTDLPVSKGAKYLYSGYSNEDIKLLKEVNRKCLFFTTRGILTQNFCEELKIDNAKFAGDIAFYNPEFNKRLFHHKNEVKKIAISDPHKYSQFEGMLEELIVLLQKRYPNSEIDILQHGKNKVLSQLALKYKINVNEIYKNKEWGLNTYDEYDLHVGFRVHGHVSALKRRIPSYLLEQDGRGADYGLTIQENVSFPAYAFQRQKLNMNVKKVFKNIAKKILGKYISNYEIFYDKAPAHFITTMIDEDKSNNFEKFIGLESSVRKYSQQNLDEIKKLP